MTGGHTTRRRKMLVADLLCGAGGSSTGCQRALDALGLEMELVCVNHWPVAIETHTRNHPEARHYVQDIATVRPHLLVPEGYLDLLMASPTCTHHSVARGGKPTSDQKRSDPWHIITWLTELRVKRVIIENVWEFCGWGPVDHRTGKPVASRKGEYFHAWIETLKRLGYEPEWRKLNAADYGDATTRSRFILMARSDGRKVHWPMPTHRRRDDAAADLFSGAKPWRPAREIIDWSIRGRSILGRRKPLAPKTLARIHAGAVKFGWPEPYLVILRNHMAAQGLDRPLPTIAANGGHIGIAEPVVVNMKGQSTASSVDSPLPTQTSHAGHLYAAEPVVVSTAHGVDAGDPDPHKRRVKSTGEPLGATHAGGKNFAIAEPVVVRSNMHGRKSPGARGAKDPLMTITTDGGIAFAEPVIINGRRGNQAKGVSIAPVPTLDTKGGVWLVEPFILNRHGDNGGVRAHALDQPAPTANCDGGGFLVEPFVLSQASGGAPRGISEPIPTAPTGGAHALISAYYGATSTCASDTDPLATITTKDRFGIVVPVTHSRGGNGARDIDGPIPTLTTAKGGEFAIVMPVTHADGSDRVRGPQEPLPTITGANRGELAFVAASAVEEPVYDILFRMLEPHELAAAMGFTTADHAYQFAGTKTEQIKQIGNAVSVAKMQACVGALMADAVPRDRARAADEFPEAAE